MLESLYVDEDPVYVQVSLNNQALVRTLLLVFVVCWTWSIVLAALAMAGVAADQASTLWILVLFCVFAPLQGFLNLVVSGAPGMNATPARGVIGGLMRQRGAPCAARLRTVRVAGVSDQEPRV